MRVVACIPFYNEAEMIAKTLDSINGKVDFIVLADGAWENFPLRNDNRLSTDGTLDIIREYDFETPFMMLYAHPWKNDMVKRDALLSPCAEGDIAFFLDANEIVLEGLPIRESSLNSGKDAWKIKMWRYDDETPAWPVRLLRWFPGIKFGQNHWTVCRADGTPLSEKDFGVSELVTHDIGHERAGWRTWLNDEYNRTQRREDEVLGNPSDFVVASSTRPKEL